ncbi:MAG: twin-arginine translocase subunit TatC, partial [Deltaproteobacteria bacterium]|nr:twin-arginine translocase subunit TatC [Deltaproteobacteria bacterium]
PKEKSMSFLAHIEELRRLIIRSFLSIAVGTGLSLYFSPWLYDLLKAPLVENLGENSHFITTSPFEAYWIYFKVALVGGILLSSPLLFYFFWSFVRPGLKDHEARPLIPIALSSGVFFSGGALFGYFLVFPPTFRFAADILKNTDIILMPGMAEYFDSSLKLLLSFGLVFELPLFLWLAGKLGLISAESLSRFRKYAIVLAFLIGGILTPSSDVLSQVLMALPMLAFYELGRLLVLLGQRKKHKKRPE